MAEIFGGQKTLLEKYEKYAHRHNISHVHTILEITFMLSKVDSNHKTNHSDNTLFLKFT